MKIVAFFCFLIALVLFSINLAKDFLGAKMKVDKDTCHKCFLIGWGFLILGWMVRFLFGV